MTPRTFHRRPRTTPHPRSRAPFQRFLTIEAFGVVHPSHRHYSQWDQMSEAERQLHRHQMAKVYVDTAAKYEHDAIFLHPNPGRLDEQLKLIDEVRRIRRRRILPDDARRRDVRHPRRRHMRSSPDPADDPETDEGRGRHEGRTTASTTPSGSAQPRRAGRLRPVRRLLLQHRPVPQPALFAEFVTPYLARLIAGYRDMGFYVIKHTDGNIMPILDQLRAGRARTRCTRSTRRAASTSPRSQALSATRCA